MTRAEPGPAAYGKPDSPGFFLCRTQFILEMFFEFSKFLLENFYDL
ncbi:hypothetical protein LEP1GSC072_3320 [Leptospira noguchii str. Bonito]|nr:hypothetical protein LEP1GSC072_3320 [Leptospira noguchii str. Bonito]